MTEENTEPQDDAKSDPRLTLEEIAEFAYQQSRRLESYVRRDAEFPCHEDSESYIPIVREIIMEASAQNHAAVMARIWDLRLGRKLADGWRYGPELDIDNKIGPDILPWAAVAEVIRMREMYFRQTVIALLPAWAGY